MYFIAFSEDGVQSQKVIHEAQENKGKKQGRREKPGWKSQGQAALEGENA